jgi:AcrR family transcriptional regulator
MTERGRLAKSSFVPQDDREALMAAFAAVVYEQGYATTRLADIAARAGVPVETVTGFWHSEAECLLDTVQTATQQSFSRLAESFMHIAGDCPLVAHLALAAMLRDMAASPEMTYLAVVELPRLGPLVQAQQQSMLDLFCEFLGPGFAAMGHPAPDPPTVSLCIGGGIEEVVRDHALRGRLHELPDALPAISYVCVCTFFGIDEAMRVSAIPVPAERLNVQQT